MPGRPARSPVDGGVSSLMQAQGEGGCFSVRSAGEVQASCPGQGRLHALPSVQSIRGSGRSDVCSDLTGGLLRLAQLPSRAGPFPAALLPRPPFAGPTPSFWAALLHWSTSSGALGGRGQVLAGCRPAGRSLSLSSWEALSGAPAPTLLRTRPLAPTLCRLGVLGACEPCLCLLGFPSAVPG